MMTDDRASFDVIQALLDLLANVDVVLDVFENDLSGEYAHTDRCTLRYVKRRDLEIALADCGWRFLRSGGRHDVWTDGQVEEAVPRHREINEQLARAILRRACKERT